MIVRISSMYSAEPPYSVSFDSTAPYVRVLVYRTKTNTKKDGLCLCLCLYQSVSVSASVSMTVSLTVTVLLAVPLAIRYGSFACASAANIDNMWMYILAFPVLPFSLHPRVSNKDE